MRRKEDRTSQILELLVKEKKLEGAELSAHLGVSQVTVRKDLDAMEAQGLITREHGFAVLSSTDDIKGRLAYHYEEKRKIALRAAALVKDGDTIMIESGSCCALLAAALAELRSGITLITNSAFIADYIRRSSDFQIILLGGIYQQDAQVMVGPMVRQCAENFWVYRFLTESEKFERHGTVPLNLKDQVKTVITDQKIEEQIITELGARGIEVLTS